MPSRPRTDGSDPGAELSALTRLDEERADLDRREVATIERARRAGATWTSIAAALGLASRQAAEQRFLRGSQRLAHRTVESQRNIDMQFGAAVVALRSRAVDLLHALRTDQRWPTRFPRAGLARSTLEAAVDAPPGALHDLLKQVTTDILDGCPAALPPSLRSALDAAVRQTRTDAVD